MKTPKTRTAKIERNTRETQIKLSLTLESDAPYAIKTSIPFLNHMLELLGKHGLLALQVVGKGDVDVDDHHLVEDVGICLGEALRQAIGDKRGMRRYGFFTLPMDETLTTVAVDFSDRPAFVYTTPLKSGRIKNFDIELVEHFFEAVCQAARMNLHINVHYGKNKHHIVESIFKAFARSVDMAVQLDPRVKSIPSSKGKL